MPIALNSNQLSWYLRDISMHAIGADGAFQAMLTALEMSETRQSHLVWAFLTSFLHHAAMISKFVSPISRKEVAVERGKALKSALAVGPESEVLPREARDNVEHFDERMDQWIEDSSPTILEIVLDDRDGYEFLRATDKRVKRLLIADELIFISEGRNGTNFELSLRPVHADIERIRVAADHALQQSPGYVYVHSRH